jgi:hypothetical protein
MTGLMTPTKDQITSFYKSALQRSLDAYARLDDKEWEKKAAEPWIARDHLAHLAGTMADETMPLTKQALAGEKGHLDGFEKRTDMLPFRQRTVDRLKDKSPAELLQMLQTGYGEHITMLEALSDADLDKPATNPAWDVPGTVRDIFFGSYLFLPAQYQEIRKAAKKKLPHWIEDSSPDQVNYHMCRIFHYMPLIFRSDRGADMTATYLFTMEGDGGGQWGVSIAGGKATSQDGAPEPHDVEIKTKPENWIDLSTGDLNPMWAITTRKVHLGGNMALALKLGDLFSSEE